MSDAGTGRGGDPDALHWFAQRDTTDLLFYRVNRRPLPQQPLTPDGEEAYPADVLDHVVECLLFGEEFETTHGVRWVLGNRDIRETERLLIGHIGFRREAQVEATDRFDAEQQEWREETEERLRTARGPFVFDAETRIVSVLRHPEFNESTVATVLTGLLNRGESDRATPAVEWEVAGTLDEPDFWEWVREADAVEEVTFNAKLPNPEGAPDFDPVLERLQEREAAAMRDTLRAADPDRGLQSLEEDELLRAGVRMASQGYGSVSGRRRHRGGDDTFDQEREVDRQKLHNLPDSWGQLISMIVDFVLVRRQDSGG